MSYVPILKARHAEIKALLTAPTKLKVTPLFELQPAPSRAINKQTGQIVRTKNSITDAAYFFDDVACWWDDELYVDIDGVSQPSEREAWWRLLESINMLLPQPVLAIPVLSLDDDASMLAAARPLAARTGRAAVRVQMAGNPSKKAVKQFVASAAVAVGLNATEVDVILDWQDSLELYDLDDLETATGRMVKSIAGACGQIITTGTPQSDKFVQAGDWHPVRREWWLWLRLAHAGIDATYGDYVLYPPAKPVPASPRYGHLRYSAEDRVHVHRRAIPRLGGGLGAAFSECCDHLVQQPYWMGASFSKADQRLEDIAGNADKESQPGSWRQIAAEHHFSLVAEQLHNPPAAPPAGTV